MLTEAAATSSQKNAASSSRSTSTLDSFKNGSSTSFAAMLLGGLVLSFLPINVIVSSTAVSAAASVPNIIPSLSSYATLFSTPVSRDNRNAYTDAEKQDDEGLSFLMLKQMQEQLRDLSASHKQLLSKMEELYASAAEEDQETLNVKDSSNSASAIPQKFYPVDFEAYFNVRSISRTEIDPAIAPLLENHKIEHDGDYAFHNKEWVELYAPYIEKGFANDRRFYVKFASDETGYGMFADGKKYSGVLNMMLLTCTILVSIMIGQPIGEYVGILTNSTISTDYQWVYPTAIQDEDGDWVPLAVDSRAVGNMLRFANHHDSPNCDVRIIPYKNAWHVMYVANQFIPKGSEILVNYGPNYFVNRVKI